MKRLSIRDIAVFAMLGALMFAGKKLMEFLPNVHPLTALTIVYTIVYRRRAIFPIIVYLVLDTFVTGGITWMVPYYYIFPLCWLCVLALPQDMPPLWAQVCYTVICTLFGLGFGTLYAPWQAIMCGLNFEKTVAWIAAGLPWDAVHAVGNFAMSFTILPLAAGLRRAEKA